MQRVNYHPHTSAALHLRVSSQRVEYRDRKTELVRTMSEYLQKKAVCGCDSRTDVELLRHVNMHETWECKAVTLSTKRIVTLSTDSCALFIELRGSVGLGGRTANGSHLHAWPSTFSSIALSLSRVCCFGVCMMCSDYVHSLSKLP